MATLIDLLYEYPVLKALVIALPLSGLLNLARANSLYRAMLHDFSANKGYTSTIVNAIGLHLFIGKHDTKLWRYLKSITDSTCSEPHHTRGSIVRGCRSCSMLVCESCIVKTSFSKTKITMESRRRYLCDTCWNTGNRLRERRFDEEIDRETCPYELYAEVRGYCACTTWDKWLCLKCTPKQTPEAFKDLVQCAGEGCLTTMRPTNCGGHLCMWCELPLVEKLGRGQSRRNYDSKHLLARAHSAIDNENPPPGNDDDHILSGDYSHSPPIYNPAGPFESTFNAQGGQRKGLLSVVAQTYISTENGLKSIVKGKVAQERSWRRVLPGLTDRLHLGRKHKPKK